MTVIEQWNEFFRETHKGEKLAELVSHADAISDSLHRITAERKPFFKEEFSYNGHIVSQLMKAYTDFIRAVHLLKTYTPYKINCVIEDLEKSDFSINECILNRVNYFNTVVSIHRSTVDGKVDGSGENIYPGRQTKLTL